MTGQLVKAAALAVEGVGAEVFIYEIVGEDIVGGRFVNSALMETLHDCDAIVFGSPTYMGGVAAQFKAFADATSDHWESQCWAGKVAAGITSGSALNGDQGLTLQYFSVLASQHGMVWVGLDVTGGDSSTSVNRLGCHLGVTAHSPAGDVDADDIESACYLARRVVAIASRLTQAT